MEQPVQGWGAVEEGQSKQRVCEAQPARAADEGTQETAGRHLHLQVLS